MSIHALIGGYPHQRCVVPQIKQESVNAIGWKVVLSSSTQ